MQDYTEKGVSLSTVLTPWRRN